MNDKRFPFRLAGYSASNESQVILSSLSMRSETERKRLVKVSLKALLLGLTLIISIAPSLRLRAQITVIDNDDADSMVELAAKLPFGEARALLIEQALEIYRSRNDVENESFCLFGLGETYFFTENYENAIPFLTSSLPILRNDVTKSRAMIMLATSYSKSKNNERAIEYSKMAIPLLQETNDKVNELLTLIDLGIYHSELSRRVESRFYFGLASPLLGFLPESGYEPDFLNEVGVLFWNSREAVHAQRYYSKALELSRKRNSRMELVNSLVNLGEVQNSLLREFANAEENFREALKIGGPRLPLVVRARIFNNLGTIYDGRQETAKAIGYYKTAVNLHIRNGSDKGMLAVAYGNVGGAFLAVGDKISALKYLRAALKSLSGQRATESYAKSSILSSIARIHLDNKDFGPAFEAFSEALVSSKIVGDVYSEAQIWLQLADYFALLERYDIARAVLRFHLHKIQVLRSKATEADIASQRFLLRSFKPSYEGALSLFTNENDVELALQIMHVHHDQQFFETSANSFSERPLILMPRETDFLGEFDSSGARLRELVEQIESESSFGRKKSGRLKIQTDYSRSKDYNAALVSLKRLISEIPKLLRTDSNQTNSKLVPNLSDKLQELMKDFHRLPNQTASLVFAFLGNDSIYFIVVGGNETKAVSIPTSGSSLNAKIIKLWALLQSDEYDTTVLSKQIYDAVFAPIEKELPKGTTTIMWSLDGNLRYIPMAALWDGKQFLAERYNHVGFTRADTERLTRAVSPKWTGTGFGTSTAQTVEVLGSKIGFSALPGVTAELGEVFRQKESDKGLLAGEVFSDKLFTKASFIEAMKKRRPLVHIASHFSFRPGDEARSFLLLGDGTAFSLSDMKAEKDLFKGVELLTLSACSTAATQPDANGREIDGFAELAQRLGAGAVMATLWPVSDASTPWLMRDFYKTRETGLTKAEALRRAQLALLNGTAETKPLPNTTKGNAGAVQIQIVPRGTKRDSGPTRSDRVVIGEEEAPKYKKDPKKPFAHPYYWAPFVLFGNWK